MNPKSPDREPGKPGFWSTVASVAASFFGVQSSRNRQRDFKKGHPLLFVAIGLAMTLLFVLVVLLAVRLALRNAGL